MLRETNSSGSRDELWNSSWETYYDSYYFEITLNRVIGRWKKLDFFTNILVACTATGSVIAGWAFWNDGTGKQIWTVLAGLTSLLSIIHAVGQVQSTLVALTDRRSSFSRVRVALESFRQELVIFPEFNVEDKYQKYSDLRNEYEQLVSKFDGDMLLTDSLANYAQTELNKKLGI